MSKEPKVSNIIRLYEDFLEGKRFTKEEIADRLEVTNRTAMRYISELMEILRLDFTLESNNRRRWHLPREQRKYQAKLDRDDMLSLSVALSLLDQYEGSYLADALSTLRDEITCWWQAEASDREEVQRWHAQKFHAIRFLPYQYRESGEVFFEVVQALASGLKLEFHYRPLSGRSGLRKVRPYSLVFHKGAFYLVALVDHAKPTYDPSCFMLARMSEAKVLEDEPYVYPKDWDPRAFYPKIEGLLKGETGRLEALFSGRLYDYLKLEREWPEGTETKREGEQVRFSADLVLNEELLNWLLGFGGEVEVLAPPGFRKQIAEKAKAAAKRYR